MKRNAYLLFVFVIALISLGAACAESAENGAERIYRMPADLVSIEEGAFAHTPVQVVVLPDGFRSMGDDAFEGAAELSDVYIPPSTDHIADTAFPQTEALTIHGAEGSYAQDWAEEHGVTFEVDNIWKLILDNERTVSPANIEADRLYRRLKPKKIGRMVPGAEHEDESMRPQDRPELNPIDYRFP